MIVDDFFEMEEKYKLFDLKTKENFSVWDIFRYHIHLKYIYPDGLPMEDNVRFSFLVYIMGFIKVIFSCISFFFKKADIIVFPNSRYVDQNELLFDKACENVIQELSDRVLIVERFKGLKNYLHSIEYNFVRLYRNMYSKLLKYELPGEILEKIDLALLETFDEVKISHTEINQLYTHFILEYRYYRFFLKFKKAKRIFLVQNGLQKGMIAAAKKLKIEFIEIQHGRIGIDHLAYSYPDFISKDDPILMPDYLLTMGSYWGKGFNIPSQVIPVGNDYFVKEQSQQKPDGSILFISSIIHGEELSKLAVKFAKANPKIVLNFKLHQNEIREIRKYSELFSGFSSIHIYTNEVELDTLIEKSILIVLINSTALYEALDSGKKVAIYKKVNFESLADCFDIPNVYFFESLGELHDILNYKNVTQQISFFESFNSKKIEAFLK